MMTQALVDRDKHNVDSNAGKKVNIHPIGGHIHPLGQDVSLAYSLHILHAISSQMNMG